MHINNHFHLQEKKLTLQSTNIKCCQKIKTKHLLETCTKYDNATTSVSGMLFDRHVLLQNTQSEVGTARTEISKFMLQFYIVSVKLLSHFMNLVK